MAAVRRVSVERSLKLFRFTLRVSWTAGNMESCCDYFSYPIISLSQQMRMHHHGLPISQEHSNTGKLFSEDNSSKRFMEAFLEATRTNSLDSPPSESCSFYSRLFSSASRGGQHPIHTTPLAPAPNLALHYFPNAPVASLFVTRPRVDKLFEPNDETEEGNAVNHGNANSSRTPLDAAKALPTLLREVAAHEAKRCQLPPNRGEEDDLVVRKHSKRSTSPHEDKEAAFPGVKKLGPPRPVFVRSVLEQCFLELYLRPIQISHERDLPGAAAPLRCTQTNGSPFYTHVYTHCVYDRLPAFLRGSLERCLASVLLASAFSFHVAWSWLVCHGHGPTALELFMLWWWANPDAILLEQAQRLLPTMYNFQQGGVCADGGESRLVGLREIAFRLSSHVARMSSAELQTAHLRGGFLTAALMHPNGYLAALSVYLRNQLPYKKYYVTSALLPHVMKTAACLSDTAFSSRPGKSSDPSVEGGRREVRASRPKKHDRGAEIFEELMRGWVFPVLCSSESASPSSFPEVSPDRIAYDPHIERSEEWIVLACTVAAIGLLERYIIETRRIHATRAATTTTPSPGDDSANPERSHRGMSDDHVRPPAEANPNLEALLSIDALRAHFLSWAWNLVSLGFLADADPVGGLQARPHVENWARVIFSTVLDCFEGSGVLHAAQVRRPITACVLWRGLHEALLRKFPHVFHGGSTVATLWVLMVLEGMSMSMPCGPLPVSFFGKEEALVVWRRLARPSRAGFEACGDAAASHPPRGAVDEAMDLWAASADAYQPLAERRRRIAFLLSGIAAPWEGKGGEEKEKEKAGNAGPPAEGAALRRPRGRRVSFAGPPASFAGNRVHWVSQAAPGGLGEADAVEALRAAEASALAVFRAHAALPVLRARAGEGGAASRAAASPSFYVLVKLLQVLAMWGQPGEEGEGGKEGRAPLWMGVVEDAVVGACAPIMGRYVRRLGLLALVRSGARGARGLLSTWPAAARGLAWERLLQALLWSTWPADAPAGGWRRPAASFGSNSLGWRVLEAWVADGRERRRGPTPSARARADRRVGEMMRHVLSFLGMLAFYIPEATRSAVSVFPALNSPPLWRLVEDVSAGPAVGNPARPTDPECNLIEQFIKTFSPPSLHDGMAKDVRTVDVQAEAEDPFAIGADEFGGQPGHPASRENEEEEATPYDSGEAVWLEELDAASSLPWEDHIAPVKNGVAFNAPLERETPRDTVRETAVLQKSPTSFVHETVDTDSRITGADIAGQGVVGNAGVQEFDEVMGTHTGGVAAPNNKMGRENDNRQATDSSFANRDEVLRSTKALRVVLKQNSPAGFHLFFSFLELIGWILSLPVPSVRWPTVVGSPHYLLSLESDFDSDELMIRWVATFSLSYTALLRIFSPVTLQTWKFPPLENDNESLLPTPSTTVVKILQDPAIMEKIILLLLNTSPDVWLICAILHCWWGSLLHRTNGERNEANSTVSITHGVVPEKLEQEESKSVQNGSDPRAMLMPRVEISLCVLLYHAGLNSSAVRTWRQRQLSKMEISPPLPRGTGSKTHNRERTTAEKWHQLHQNVLESIFQSVMAEEEEEEEENCKSEPQSSLSHEDSLLHIIGSMTLLSIEERAVWRRQQARRRDGRLGAHSPGKDPTAFALPSPYPTNFYVNAFLQDTESVSGVRCPPVIFPSQQLASVVNGRSLSSSLGGSAPHVETWRNAWRHLLSPEQKVQLRHAFACRSSTSSALHSMDSSENSKRGRYGREAVNMQNASLSNEADDPLLGASLLSEDDNEFVNLFTSLIRFPDA